MVRRFKIIVEKHSDGYVAYPLDLDGYVAYPLDSDGYVAYPLGLNGVVIGEGDTYEDVLTNVKSAITFHIETFGTEVFNETTLY